MATRDDWTLAALSAMAKGGIAAVAVDPIATELGISRGSFYWHFADRNALLVAALEMWELKATTEIIDAVAKVSDPRKRLEALFCEAFGDEGIAGLEPTLLAHADHPAVAPVLTRVTERRIEFIVRVCTDLGMPPVEARRHAVFIYATYLGWFQLRRAAPLQVPEVAASGQCAADAVAHVFAQIVVAVDCPSKGAA